MAVRNASVPTLLDVTKTLNPDGTQAEIAEILTQDNPALEDMAWAEGNLVTGDRFTVRTGKPAVGFRRLNQGIPRSKSTSEQVDEAAAILEANFQVDRKLAILSGNVAAYRINEGRPFLESMNEQMSETLFYGNSFYDSREFTGLAPRYNSTGNDQVIDAGGTGTDNRSLWLIVWGLNTISGIFPRNTVGGLLHMDVTNNRAAGPDGHPIGDMVLDPDGNPYLAYQDHWEWNCGLRVKDPRYAVRIANIDRSLLTRDRSTGADLEDLIVQAFGRIKSLNGNAAFYAPRDIYTMLDRQALNDKRGFLGYADVGGKQTTTIRGVPLRQMDALNIDEARVVA